MSMKPNWDEAPDWAQWLAQDANGEWSWYQMRPHKVFDWVWYAGGKIDTCKGDFGATHKWESTLEERPCTPNT